MKRILFGLLAVAGLAFTGCTVAEKPIGGEPAKLRAADWNGVWTLEDSPVKIEVIDADKGILRLSDVEKKVAKSDEPADIEVRTSHGWMFFNVMAEDDDPPEPGKPKPEKTFIWGRLERDGDTVTAWMPDTEKFTALVKAEKLTGTIDDSGSLTLRNVTEAQLRSLVNGDFGDVWVEEKMVLKRSK